MRRPTLTALIAALVLVVAAVTATAGLAATLSLSEGARTLVPGEQIYLSHQDLNVSTPGDYLECDFPPNALTMQVLSNGQARDELKIDEMHGFEAAPCRSFTGNADVALLSLGGPVSAGANGKTKTSSDAVVSVVYEHERYNEVEYREIDCVFSRHKLKGHNSATAMREPFSFELEGKLSLDAVASSENAKHLCPKQAEVEVSPASIAEGEGDGAIEQQKT